MRGDRVESGKGVSGGRMLKGKPHATVLRSLFSSSHGTVGLPLSPEVKTTLRKPRANSLSVLRFPRPPSALLIAQVRHRSCFLAGTLGHYSAQMEGEQMLFPYQSQGHDL